MSWLTKYHKQDVTYWSSPTIDGYGNPTFATRQVIKGRWEDKHEQFRDQAGNETISNAIVYLGVDVSIGDYLYLGSSTASDPNTVDGSREVRQFEKTPDLNNTIYERKVFL